MVKLRREELHLTQEQLANKLGYKDKSPISKMENGRQVSQKMVVKLAKALQCDPTDLFDISEEEIELRNIIEKKMLNLDAAELRLINSYIDLIVKRG